MQACGVIPGMFLAASSVVTYATILNLSRNSIATGVTISVPGKVDSSILRRGFPHRPQRSAFKLGTPSAGHHWQLRSACFGGEAGVGNLG